MKISRIFEELRQTSSRNEKINILKKYEDNNLLKDVILYALSPDIQFYQRKIPDFVKTGSEIHLSEALYGVNETLASRKLTGNAAVKYFSSLLGSLSSDDAEILKMVVLKNLDCGIQASTVNKVWPGLIREYPCMLCSPYDEKLISKINFPAVGQIKMDGMRFNAKVDVTTASVDYYTRNGKLLDINHKLMDAGFILLAKTIGISRVVFDGELLIDGMDRKTGNGILNKAQKGTIIEKEKFKIIAYIWDMIPLIKFIKGKCSVDYLTRLNSIMDVYDVLSTNMKTYIKITESFSIKSKDHAEELFQTYYRNGHEGIIVKDSTSIWEDKRSRSQIKFKGEKECELVCVDWIEGTGKYKGMLGALKFESKEGGIKVDVGSGFTDEERTIFNRSVIGKIATIKFNHVIDKKQTGKLVTRSYDSLFLPIFIEFRDDKTEVDCYADIKKL